MPVGTLEGELEGSISYALMMQFLAFPSAVWCFVRSTKKCEKKRVGCACKIIVCKLVRAWYRFQIRSGGRGDFVGRGPVD